MKSLYILLAVIILGMFASCDPTTEKDAANAAIDSTSRTISSSAMPNCWINEESLQREVFHSAPYASRLDTAWQYSYGIRAMVKDLSNELPKSVDVSFWAMMPATGINSTLVLSVDSVDKNKAWVGLSLKDSIKTANQWKLIKANIPMPAQVTMDDKVTIYIWSVDQKLMYIDDVDFKFIYR